MERHPLDRPLGSDLSYQVAKFRREHPELEAGRLDSTNQRLRSIPCIFDGYIADRNAIPDSFQGEVGNQLKLSKRG